MNSRIRILFIGDLSIGHCANSLVEGFDGLGIETRTLDTSTYMQRQEIGSPEWFQRKIFKQPSKAWQLEFKCRLHACTSDWKPDIVFCINTIHIPQELIHSIECKMKVHLSFDDISNVENVTLDYLKFEQNWDVIFTNKIYNVKELEVRTQSKIVHFQNAYNPRIHFLNKSFEFREMDFGFIGANRDDRNDLPLQLKKVFPLKAVIAGPRWRRSYPFGVKGVSLLPEVLNKEYTLLGNNIKIGICLLNSANRDQITTRSFELPALGQLIVGQKTLEHEELLEHGKEAFWFDNIEEMIDFSKQLLNNMKVAKKVASAGFMRITTGKNTYADRALSILSVLK